MNIQKILINPVEPKYGKIVAQLSLLDNTYVSKFTNIYLYENFQSILEKIIKEKDPHLLSELLVEFIDKLQTIPLLLEIINPLIKDDRQYLSAFYDIMMEFYNESILLYYRYAEESFK